MDQHQNSNAKPVCQHQPGDEWKDGCCGNDALAQANLEQVSQFNESNQKQDRQTNLAFNEQFELVQSKNSPE